MQQSRPAMACNDVQWLLSTEAEPLEPLAYGREIHARHGGKGESSAVTVSRPYFIETLA